ncbi:MAG: hypothetical protein EXR62_03880 [Chloroflexi bacterium]|nr:hypothetical protein [Chloroflexota bacterium]
MKRILPVTLAVLTGMIIVADYLLSIPWLDALGAGVIRTISLLAATALLLGLLNLMQVHGRRLRHLQSGWPYSLVLLGGAALVLVLGLWPDEAGAANPEIPTIFSMAWIFAYVIGPLQSTVLALIAIFAATTAYRGLRFYRPEMFFFAIGALVVLLGSAPGLQQRWDFVAPFRDWFLAVPGAAGVQGLLLGVGLGVLLTGLRIITGLERPYLQARPAAPPSAAAGPSTMGSGLSEEAQSAQSETAI